MGSIKDLFNKKENTIGEIVRFCTTGVVSTVASYFFYYVLLRWLNPTLSFTVSYLIAMFINYLMTTAFTFKVKANKKNAIGFVISNAINYGLCALFLNIFIWVGISKKLAPIPMYAVCVPINFLIVRSVMKKK